MPNWVQLNAQETSLTYSRNAELLCCTGQRHPTSKEMQDRLRSRDPARNRIAHRSDPSTARQPLIVTDASALLQIAAGCHNHISREIYTSSLHFARYH